MKSQCKQNWLHAGSGLLKVSQISDNNKTVVDIYLCLTQAHDFKEKLSVTGLI